MKPSFQTEWLALPPKETHQVLEKIALLTQDPTPDAKVKKQLPHLHGKLHRIRSGDYRIFYTFEQPYISLLALRRRNEDTYDEDLDVELLGGFDPEFSSAMIAAQSAWEKTYVPRVETEKHYLPLPISEDLLTNLHVPREYYAQLSTVQTEEDLLDCPGVPASVLEKLIEYIFPRPLDQVVQQPDYLVEEVDDLLRFKEGKLLGFLLQLAPEQEKVAHWSMNATGPTQVKGGPGTGKSTVALYRVRSLIQNLRKMDQPTPHILFTTYTNALVKASQQLLRQLIGDDLHCIQVITADKLVWSIVRDAGLSPNIARDNTLDWLIKKAVEQIQSKGNVQQSKALERLNYDYLLEEICQVILARQITTLEEYLAADRGGRKFGLRDTGREAVWQVYELFLQQLQQMRQVTWQQVRLRAEALFPKNHTIQPYDAVVVDEAQDLDPSVLRLLFGLCKAPNRFFITADANQSIYRSGFTWSDVHESLNFQGGRTRSLKTNYRTTRQISDAALSYLANGAVEDEAINSMHLYRGPMPMLQKACSEDEEVQLLSKFLREAARECRLSLGSCAVLCPTQAVSIFMVKELDRLGVRAAFMSGQSFDLKFSGVKVMTIHSSKGLEFPIVAMAGFINTRYAKVLENARDEGREEILERYRRTLFVGMTRAMRALLMTVPAQTNSPLLRGFDATYWNLGG